MPTSMLIDTAHPEETRVVVVKGKRLEEFNFETSTKAQLKGNIYLAKVTRVEPSLQAAFVDYGGNRHGFLAFNEIHPDYYQIPVADREALLAEEAAAAKEDAARDDEEAEREAAEDDDDDAEDENDADAEENGEPDEPDSENDGEDEGDGEDDTGDTPDKPKRSRRAAAAAADKIEDARPCRPSRLRSYKIQEVIKRRQILLVQVVKEERGTKGAALTTYISLAGRYCVLMPNTARGGGISRKITDAKDRRRLKSILGDLETDEGMALIVRTAGAERSRAEIRRDYDYLYRLWETVRETTLKLRAPSLIHEEANLIKRSIRDLYNKDIGEVLVEGEEGYKTAKSFMRMLMPSHAKRVQRYREDIPLFHKFQIDAQLDSMMSPEVGLKSGGYLVIGTTEALVAIDVNSGRATRERNIEETALRTNLEAAEEVGRQLRLRDLGGLVVIDFIDMDYPRNNRAVERKLKEALKHDRARIQVGRISAFGLLEMSRQRMRPSLIEASTETCAACGGTGFVRSTESSALHVLRAIEDDGTKGEHGAIEVFVAAPIATYLLNQKRTTVRSLEKRYGMKVFVSADDSLVPPTLRIEEIGTEKPQAPSSRARTSKTRASTAEPRTSAAEPEAPAETEDAEAGGEDRPRKGRRRGKRGGRRRRRDGRATPDAIESDAAPTETGEAGEAAKEDAAEPESASEESGEESKPRRAPRRRRPRRRKTETAAAAAGEDANVAGATAEGETKVPDDGVPADATAPAEAASSTVVSADTGEAADRPERMNAPAPASAPPATPETAPEPASAQATSEPEEAAAAAAAETGGADGTEDADSTGEPAKPSRSGWWRLPG